MKIEVPFLGKTKENYLDRGILDFSARLSHYAPVNIIQIKVKNQKGKSDSEIKSYESCLLENSIESGGYRIALDCKGKMLTSEGLSQLIIKLEHLNVKKVYFIIGGPLGLADDQLERADLLISLSSMTFTHDMARFILLEQLYRAYTIKMGEKYHK